MILVIGTFRRAALLFPRRAETRRRLKSISLQWNECSQGRSRRLVKFVHPKTDLGFERSEEELLEFMKP